MKARRPYSRHGLNALMARVKVRGLGAVDGRSAAARALMAWKREIVEDLGGAAGCSSAERTIVDLAATTKLLLDSTDAWLVEQPSLINGRRRALLPVVLQRQQLADSLARYMTMLGLKRRRRPVPSLAEYVAARYGGAAGNETPQRPQEARSAGSEGQGTAPQDDPLPGGHAGAPSSVVAEGDGSAEPLHA